MPIYTYKCNICGYIDEILVTVEKRDKKILCDQDWWQTLTTGCEGVMKRNADAPSFHLKGGGWCKDGYAKKPSKQENKK